MVSMKACFEAILGGEYFYVTGILIVFRCSVGFSRVNGKGCFLVLEVEKVEVLGVGLLIGCLLCEITFLHYFLDVLSLGCYPRLFSAYMISFLVLGDTAYDDLIDSF